MEKNRSFIRVFLIAGLAWGGSVLLGVFFGSTSHPSLDVIWQIRFPRVILASLLGAGLSIAGAVLQALFSNPLCDPYTLGISSGAALGAMVGFTIGIEGYVLGLMGSAFLGALAFAGLLFFIGSRIVSSNIALLLSGVLLGFLGMNLVTVWSVFTDPRGVQAAMGWLFGDLSRARMGGALFSGMGILAIGVCLWFQRRGLDALLLGEEAAMARGVDVHRLRQSVILLSSVLVGVCVSAGGMIGFVGLIVPHFVRQIQGSLHSKLIPLCMVWGATFLTLADCLSRIVVRPLEVPVGVVTALIGVPLYLVILLQGRMIRQRF